MRKTTLLLALVLMGALAVIGCRKGVPIENPSAGISVSKSLTQAQVRKAIYAACPMTGWVPHDVSTNTIEAALTVRGKHHIVVDIDYSPNMYTIKHKSTSNMGEKDGNIHPNYNKWVNTLRHNIDRQLAVEANK